jgi:sigma-B regulation protein RsbU (phosphoserine phosphatase)
MVVFMAAITGILALACGLFYQQTSGLIREQLRERLMITAGIVAADIDGEAHERIRSQSDPEYQAIWERFQRLIVVHPSIRVIYTMRATRGPQWHFVLDSEDPSSELASSYGTPYDVSGEPEISDGLKGLSASKKLYPDDYGVWLSGYAPIRGQDGVAHSIVGVDMSAEQVLAKEAEMRRIILMVFSLGLVVAFGASVWLASFLNKPIGQLVKGTRLAAEGDLTAQVPEDRKDELGELAHAFNVMLGELNRQREELREQERMRGELATARRIQQAMLPASAPESGSLNIDFFAESASEVGGDYFDFLPVGEHQMAIAIGDVTGHGVPAALLMAVVRSCLHTQVLTSHRVSDVMKVANSLVRSSSLERQLMTFFYSILDTRTGVLTYANAGHLHPYLYRAATGTVETLPSGSYPLGVRDGTTYAEKQVQLQPGDLLVFYSDGIIEAQSPAGEEFGFDRMEGLVCRLGPQPADRFVTELLGEWRQFTLATKEQPTEDDVTVVAVKLASAGVPLPA